MFGKSLEGGYFILRIKDRSVSVDSYGQIAVNVLMKISLLIRMRDHIDLCPPHHDHADLSRTGSLWQTISCLGSCSRNCAMMIERGSGGWKHMCLVFAIPGLKEQLSSGTELSLKQSSGSTSILCQNIQDASGFYALDKILTLAVILKLGHQSHPKNLFKADCWVPFSVPDSMGFCGI